METVAQIESYFSSLTEAKCNEMQQLHKIILQIDPKVQLSFLDGKNSDDKTVANPNVGYGFQHIRYADGITKPFYKVGISANKVGISVYILSLKDRTYLRKHYDGKLGKASITGYCVKFKSLQEIDIAILEEIITQGLKEGL